MDVVIASKLPPNYVGGLAAYQRMLAKVLSESYGMSGCFINGIPLPRTLPRAKDLLTWEILPAKPNLLHALFAKWWPAMASRRWMHPTLAATLGTAWKIPAVGNPRVVHFVGTGWDFFGFAMHQLARRTGATFTIWPAVHISQWGDDEIDLRLYRLADTIFCQSRHEVDYLTARGMRPANLVRCGLPPMCLPDGDSLQGRRKWNIGDRLCVLFIGRRDAGKGYPALLTAWKQVLQVHPDAVLLVAGPEQEDRFALDGIPPASIRDLGVPDEAEKAEALAACDIFCLPSAHESFGVVYVEAWSYGKPVICGSAPASREWIDDGVTGLWADQSPDSIAAAIVTLLSDRDLRCRMGNAGRAYQRENLSCSTFAAAHQAAFKL